MKFEIKNRTELWIGGKYHGCFSRFEDMLEYVYRWATWVPEIDPQQKLEWD